MASSLLYLGVNFGGPLHFETGLHVTTTTVSVYGICRYFTCLFSDSNFLKKERSRNISWRVTNLILPHPIIDYKLCYTHTHTDTKSREREREREREYSIKKDEIREHIDSEPYHRNRGCLAPAHSHHNNSIL